MPPERKRYRCAIYTRKSSEEGLEQSFNSLDAQREACAAYIESQRHEGWKAVDMRYDDGGYSGGSMDRPALKALLEDLQAGKVDVVVVYKVDRLTQALADFAKIVELFDRHKVSFVSVTQQFNTTSSMGRLTLNVLLSFAQFEREVTGERIRDKIAASKKKGMWMGGYVPLGYNLKDRKLLINKHEADIVRRIYDRYLALGCVRKLQADLIAKGVKSKIRTSAGGKKSGGVSYSRGALYDILQSRIYLGEIAHKDAVHAGQHEGIVPRKVWDAVQARLRSNGQARRLGLNAKTPSLLAGFLYDPAGNRYTPLHTTKNGKRYRYYTSQAVIQNGPAATGVIARLPAHDIEELVAKRLLTLLKTSREVIEIAAVSDLPASQQANILRAAKEKASSWSTLPTSTTREFLRRAISRIVIHEKFFDIEIPQRSFRAVLLDEKGQSPTLDASAPSGSEDVVRLRVEAQLRRTGGEVRIVLPTASSEPSAGRPDPVLLKSVARARRWYEMLVSGEAPSIRTLAKATGVDERYLSRTIRLAFLAPDVVKSLLEGSQPPGQTLDKLMRNVPISWDQQRSAFAN